MAFSSGVMRYFYPRPPRGGRPVRFLLLHVQQDFYPRPPRGGRQSALSQVIAAAQFLSTPSARRATGDVVSAQHIVDISIHALREEGDLDSDIAQIIYKISIHALREEGDMLTLFAVADVAVFLSTPSARRATSFMATCTG